MGLKLVKYGTSLALILLITVLLVPQKSLRELERKSGMSPANLQLLVDKTANLAKNDLEIGAFNTVKEVFVDPNDDVTNAYWLQINLDSTLRDSLQNLNGPLYYYFGVHDEIDFFTASGDSIKGGLFHKKESPNNTRFYFPLNLEAKNHKPIVRIKDHFWIKDTIIVEIFDKAKKSYNEDYVYRMGDHQYILFSVALLSVLAYAIVFFLMQYIQVRERAFLFYSIYLICVFFYFLRGFEYRTEYFVFFSNFPGSVIYWEPVILFLTHGFYAPFIYYFLDVPKKSPHLKKIFDQFFYIIVGAFIISTLMMVALNFDGMAAQLYLYVFIALLLSMVGIIAYAIKKLDSQLTIFVLVGTFFLCLSVIMNYYIYSTKCQGVYPEKFWHIPQVYSMIGVLLELLCFSFGLGYKNKLSAIERNKLQAQQAQSEQKALSSQLNSHMLFNCLNSIRELIEQNKNGEASEYLVKFSVFIRGVLETSERRNSTLEKELEVSESYLALEALSFDDSFHYSIEVEDNVDTSFISLPPLILQPYIENALIHGLASKEGEKWLRIKVVEEEEAVKCFIDDNGIGIIKKTNLGPTLAKPKRSLGRKLSEERINVFNKIYDTQISVNTINKVDEEGKAQGTRIEFLIHY